VHSLRSLILNSHFSEYTVQKSQNAVAIVTFITLFMTTVLSHTVILGH
jgi:hypothetical protein